MIFDIQIRNMRNLDLSKACDDDYFHRLNNRLKKKGWTRFRPINLIQIRTQNINYSYFPIFDVEGC